MKLSSLLPDIGPPVFHHRAVGQKIRTDVPNPMESQWEISRSQQMEVRKNHIFGHILGGYPLKLRPEK
jgi:hypothetical protein